MTYQNLGYWIGQANDTSTGTHPPGWTNGQRWSETAGEWQGDRNAWYGNAVDTSGGRHPPGWSNGQLWSETATEWMNDRDAWYNQAQAWYTSRYNDGYNAGYTAGQASAQAKVFQANLNAMNLPYGSGPLLFGITETNDPWGLFSTAGGNMTCVNTGTYTVFATAPSGSNQWGGQNGWGIAILYQGGNVTWISSQTAGGMDGNVARPGAYARVACGAGGIIQIQAYRGSNSGYDYNIGTGNLEILWHPTTPVLEEAA
jgi:hypothetical protein